MLDIQTLNRCCWAYLKLAKLVLNVSLVLVRRRTFVWFLLLNLRGRSVPPTDIWRAMTTEKNDKARRKCKMKQGCLGHNNVT